MQYLHPESITTASARQQQVQEMQWREAGREGKWEGGGRNEREREGQGEGGTDRNE